jgi:hypothetical protein
MDIASSYRHVRVGRARRPVRIELMPGKAERRSKLQFAMVCEFLAEFLQPQAQNFYPSLFSVGMRTTADSKILGSSTARD